MKKELTYNHTMLACFGGYIVQGIVNNFVPLLFLTFQDTYQLSLSQITFLVTLNFSVQLLIDLCSAFFVDRLGYRLCVCSAHFCVALGFILLIILPDICPDAYIGILISVVVYAMGGGLLEVIISPLLEACPTTHKESAMSLLHSFYCWGHVGVILISTAFFATVGIQHWKVLALLWIAIALTNMIFFTQTPIAPLIPEGYAGWSFRELLSKRNFWIFFVMMICSGAAELSVSQWASALAENGLGVSKAVGDLAGPMSFAILMGISRTIFGKYGDRLNLHRYMSASCVLCVISYLMIALVPYPVINLMGCALCGFSVGILWPGSFSRASAMLPLGGTRMFALLALGGDIGCSAGPTFTGMIASHFGDDLQVGLMFGVIFPMVLLVLFKLRGQARRD